MSTKPLTELFGANQATELSPEYINQLLRELEGRLQSLEVLRGGLQEVIGQSQNIAVDRLNDVLSPAQVDLDARIQLADQRLQEIASAISDVNQLVSNLQSGVLRVSDVEGLQGALNALHSREAAESHASDAYHFSMIAGA